MTTTKGGAFAALRFAIAVFIASLALSGFLAGFTYWYWENEKKNDKLSERSLNDMRTRLATAQRERDDLRNSEDTYQTLLHRGTFVAERRLDFVEAMQALRERHRLQGLEYELTPQRPLKLAGDASVPAIDVRASRITLRIRALHDGDLVAFLDEFPRLQRGLFPMDRCTIKRAALPAAAAPKTENEAERPAVALAGVEAQCSLEWITLAEKSASPGVPARQP